jgi:hypothetical protein
MGAGGFEPPKADPTGLQPVPFDRSEHPLGSAIAPALLAEPVLAGALEGRGVSVEVFHGSLPSEERVAQTNAASDAFVITVLTDAVLGARRLHRPRAVPAPGVAAGAPRRGPRGARPLHDAAHVRDLGIESGVQLWYLAQVMGTSVRELEDTYACWLTRTDDQLRAAFDTYDAAGELDALKADTKEAQS